MEDKRNDEARTWEPMEIEDTGHVGEVMQGQPKFSDIQTNGRIQVGDDTF